MTALILLAAIAGLNIGFVGAADFVSRRKCGAGLVGTKFVIELAGFSAAMVVIVWAMPHLLIGLGVRP